MLTHTIIIRDLSGNPRDHATEIGVSLDEASANGYMVHSWQIIPAQHVTVDQPSGVEIQLVSPERLFIILVRSKTEVAKPADRNTIGMGMKS